MYKKILLFLAISTITWASSVQAKDPPRLPGIELQQNYKITTLFLDEPSIVALASAVVAWNEAAQDPQFMTAAQDSTEANVWVTSLPIAPVVEGGQVYTINGIMLPLAPDKCVIVLSEEKRYNIETITHELGHCLSLAHHPENPRSIMFPVAEPGKTRAITKETAKWLRAKRSPR